MKNYGVVLTLTVVSLSIMACKQEAVSAVPAPQEQAAVSAPAEAAVVAETQVIESAVAEDALQLAANDSMEAVEGEESASDDEAFQAADQTCQEQAQSSEDSQSAYNGCMESLGFPVGSGDGDVVTE